MAARNEKGVLFDFDGVIVKSMEQHFQAWQKAFAHYDIALKPEEFFILEGQGVETIVGILGQRYGLQDEQIRQVQADKISYYDRHHRIEFYDYFFPLIDKLKAEGIPLGVVTGGARHRVKPVIEKYFKEKFDCLVTVDDVPRGKPFPDPFLKAADMLGIDPQDCLVVENAPLGIEAARAAGMFTVGITTTLDASELQGANQVVNDFRQVERIILSWMTNGSPAGP